MRFEIGLLAIGILTSGPLVRDARAAAPEVGGDSKAGVIDATADVHSFPGYCDFNLPGLVSHRDLKLDLVLEGDLLRWGAGLTMWGEPDVALLVSGLRQVRVASFDIGPDRAEKVDARIADIAKRLEGKGWFKVVRTHKADSQAYVFLKLVEGAIDGVVVMNVDSDGKASFVNVVGRIEPEQLGRLGTKFHIDGLDRIEIGSTVRTHRDSDRDGSRDSGRARDSSKN
jgi:hypothetical protein